MYIMNFSEIEGWAIRDSNATIS